MFNCIKHRVCSLLYSIISAAYLKFVHGRVGDDIQGNANRNEDG